MFERETLEKIKNETNKSISQHSDLDLVEEISSIPSPLLFSTICNQVQLDVRSETSEQDAVGRLGGVEKPTEIYSLLTRSGGDVLPFFPELNSSQQISRI